MPITFWKLSVPAVITLFAMQGCAAKAEATDDGSDDGDDNGAAAEGAITSSSRSVALQYEGTCQFLRNCSTWSKTVAAPNVLWGCVGASSCDDDGLWVAGPSKAYCGKSVQICKGSKCTTATVKDISASAHWEASNGVLDAIELPHGLRTTCGGYGGGNVTLSVGVNTVAAGTPSTGGPTVIPPTPAASIPDARGNGCFSASLNEDVSELVCVAAKDGSSNYQCKMGLWYRGGSGDQGKFGACKANTVTQDD